MLSEHWDYPADRDWIGPARRAAVGFVRDCGGADEGALRDIALAISEVVTNVVLHAYCDDDPGRIDIGVEVDPGSDTATVTVVDDGHGMVSRTTQSPGAGLGLGIVEQLSKRFEVSSADGGRGTSIQMTFGLGTPQDATSSESAHIHSLIDEPRPSVR